MILTFYVLRFLLWRRGPGNWPLVHDPYVLRFTFSRRHSVIRHSNLVIGQRTAADLGVEHLAHFVDEALLGEGFLQHIEAGIDDSLVADVVVGIAGDEEDFHFRLN